MGVKVNFVKLLAAKSEEENQTYTLPDAASGTGIDRRKLYTLRDMSDVVNDDDKYPLKWGETVRLCDWLGCRFSDLVEYTPSSPLEAGQQVRALRGNAVALAK